MSLVDGLLQGEVEASSTDGWPGEQAESEPHIAHRGRAPGGPQTTLSVQQPCVRCGEPVTLEAVAMGVWCQPLAPTYTPFPQVLQRDCACGGHANHHVALLLFDPRTS